MTPTDPNEPTALGKALNTIAGLPANELIAPTTYAGAAHDAILERMGAVFNEWARRYAEDPTAFSEILGDDGQPIEDYGAQCAAYFHVIAEDLEVNGKMPPPVEDKIHGTPFLEANIESILAKTECFNEEGQITALVILHRDGTEQAYGDATLLEYVGQFRSPNPGGQN